MIRIHPSLLLISWSVRLLQKYIGPSRSNLTQVLIWSGFYHPSSHRFKYVEFAHILGSDVELCYRGRRRRHHHHHRRHPQSCISRARRRRTPSKPHKHRHEIHYHSLSSHHLNYPLLLAHIMGHWQKISSPSRGFWWRKL